MEKVIYSGIFYRCVDRTEGQSPCTAQLLSSTVSSTHMILWAVPCTRDSSRGSVILTTPYSLSTSSPSPLGFPIGQLHEARGKISYVSFWRGTSRHRGKIVEPEWGKRHLIT